MFPSHYAKLHKFRHGVTFQKDHRLIAGGYKKAGRPHSRGGRPGKL